MPDADLHRFRLLAEATGDAICDWDILNDRSWLSERWQELYGPMDGDKLDTATWLGMLHPDDRRRIERELTDILAGDAQHWVGEYRFRRADGTYAHILERACILRDDAGRATRLVAAMTDLTRHKQTEEALRESRRQVAALMSNLPGMAYRCANEPSWRMVFVSEGAAALTGHRPEALLPGGGIEFGDLIHPQDRPRVWRQVQVALKEGRPFTLNYRIVTADDRIKWCWEQGRSVIDAITGEPLIEGFICDATAQHEAEAALRDSERMLNEVTTHIDECFWVHDVDKARGIYISPAAERIWGIALQTLRDDAMVFLDVVHPDDREKVAATGAQQQSGREIEVEYRIHRRGDGALRWVQTRAFPVFDDAGRFYRICGVSRDITARKLEEARLRESEEHHRQMADSNRRLLAEVNHRVRNNLASLRSLIQMTCGEASTPVDFAEALDRRLSAMAQAHGLLADAAWQDLDLRTLIEAVHRPVRPMQRDSGSLRLQGPPVRVTPRQSIPLAMTLMEMVTNSGKHGALSVPRGRVDVSWRLDDKALHIQWREADGPPVQPPVKPSLGTELIEGFIRYELGGQCDLRYPPTGADHRLTIPV